MSRVMSLLDIQKLQFRDREQAQAGLLEFLKQTEDPAILSVELKPRPESLNSINGFITYTNGERYFFKAHVEENEQIEEYYNSDLLARFNYPIVKARQVKQRPGQQLAIYEILNYPTFFDLIKAEEDLELAGGSNKDAARMIEAQSRLDKLVCQIYQDTLAPVEEEEHAGAPIHQLFSHRLQEDGRVGLFYRDGTLALPTANTNDTESGSTLSFDRLAKMRWEINSARYHETLEQIIFRSRQLLAPNAAPSIIGHGDAHNGNLFVDVDNQSGNWQLMMFDPAFAGRHHILLDLTKPLFHNIFARWMYFPEEVAQEFDISCKLADDTIVVQHDFKISRLRMSFLEGKIKDLIIPTIEYLNKKHLLPADWREYLRSSLFCCPFLTVNLCAKPNNSGTLAERYSPAVRLLALSMCLEFGCTSRSGSTWLSALIDEILA